MPKMRSAHLIGPIVAAAFGSLAMAAPAAASPPSWTPAHGMPAHAVPADFVYDSLGGSWVDPRFMREPDRRDRRAEDRRMRRAYEQGYRDALRQQGWDTRHAGWGSPADPWASAQPLGRRDVVWRGRDGRAYCRRSDGTTGVVIGAIAGGTLGNVIAGDGQRRLGSIVGGSLGAIIGRELDRGSLRCA